MDWLILLLLIPAVIVPVVLLYGFAGCAAVYGVSTIYPPRSPTNLAASATPSAQAGSAVLLTWQNTDPVEVQIERAEEGGDFVTLTDPATGMTLLVNGETYTDEGLDGGVNFIYQVRGNDQGLPANDPSDTATVHTFRTAFLADNVTANTDQPGVNGFCVVQIISNTLLKAGGALASVSLRGPSGGSLTLDQVYISNVAATGDPFDSDVTPVRVTSALALNNDTTAITQAALFVVDMSKPLLIAFDVNPNVGTMRYGTLPPPGGATAYAKKPPAPGGATAEAALMDRAPPYNMAAVLYLIQKIEVI